MKRIVLVVIILAVLASAAWGEASQDSLLQYYCTLQGVNRPEDPGFINFDVDPASDLTVGQKVFVFIDPLEAKQDRHKYPDSNTHWGYSYNGFIQVGCYKNAVLGVYLGTRTTVVTTLGGEERTFSLEYVELADGSTMVVEAVSVAQNTVVGNLNYPLDLWDSYPSCNLSYKEGESSPIHLP